MTASLNLLGSTGSIGTQALSVAKALNIPVRALAAGRRIDLLEQQAREFHPKMVAVNDLNAAKELRIALADTDIRVAFGEEGICEAAAGEGDTTLNAIVGIAGLKPTLSAISAGKTLALANKESLVTGGNLVKKSLRENGGTMLPVDSEHSAIFQSLQGTPPGSLAKILLTASGGPFFSKTAKELENATVEQALRHPNWNMGRKITVDSATLMNKGLEVIEAVHLFDVPAKDIEVVVQRESIIHSGVFLKDGALMVQMGVPDMKLPIQYALTYPQRYACSPQPNLFEIGCLHFDRPDRETFRCLDLCVRAIETGGLKPAAVNGANEEAVALFLDGKIRFLQIAELCQAAMEQQSCVADYSLEDVLEADQAARLTVRKLVMEGKTCLS